MGVLVHETGSKPAGEQCGTLADGGTRGQRQGPLRGLGADQHRRRALRALHQRKPTGDAPVQDQNSRPRSPSGEIATAGRRY